MVTHPSHSKQAPIPPGTNPDAPRTTDAAPGSLATAAALAFSRPCSRCRAIVSLPWCPILTAVLDRLDALETGVREYLPGEIAVVHARLLWLEAALRDLQAPDEEVPL